jgi:hypothetical protein
LKRTKLRERLIIIGSVDSLSCPNASLHTPLVKREP